MCYGQRGEIRKRYRVRQKDQLEALRLVTGSVVLLLGNSLNIKAAVRITEAGTGSSGRAGTRR
ncbi:Tn3 family transposase (plasmid) [Pantoea agglomerans]|nr:hypothetical protein FOV68_11485 [Pantoea sp. paga]WEC74993.1 Tn3 family transposase [Pantoea agglomerans]